MKTRKLRILSALLALAMLFTLLPTAAFAADTAGVQFDVGNLKYEVMDEGEKTAKVIGFADSATDADKTSIDVPATVTYNNVEYKVIKIQDGIFRENNTLKTVTLHEGLEKIGGSAFIQCSELTSINIPSTVTEIGTWCFYDDVNLNTVTFNTASDGTSQLKKIQDRVFQYCEALTSITIPASVESIDYQAFYDCDALTTVTFADNSQLQTIGSSAFSGCSALATINVPASVTSVDSSAFDDCSNLAVTITLDPNYEGGQTYKEKAQLYGVDPSFTKPTRSGYGFVGWYMDLECTREFDRSQQITKSMENMTLYAKWVEQITRGNLKYEVIDEGAKTAKVVGFADSATDADKASIDVPVTINYNGADYKVIKIQDAAFNGNKKLVTVTLHDGLEEIGGSAFQNSTLKSINIPSTVTYIGTWCFDENTSLQTVTFDGTSQLKKIEESTFQNCDTLKSITIPASVENIDYQAFYDCDDLTTVTFAAGSQLKTIGSYAFEDCSVLENISIPASVTSVSSSAFNGCDKLAVTITLDPNYDGGQTYVEKVSFYDTDPSFDEPTRGGYSFAGWYTDKECTKAFDYDQPITKNFTLYAKWERQIANGNLKYNVLSEDGQTVQVAGFADGVSDKTTVEIPATVEIDGKSYKVVKIKEEAFYDEDDLTTVSFAAEGQLQAIGDCAFKNCESLKEITIPASVESIGDDAFEDCDALTAVTFADNSQLQTIGDYAFADCGSLTEITIPASVKSIGEGAFFACDILETVNFVEGSQLQTIGISAFSKTSLKEITIPASVTTIEGRNNYFGAFESCTKLETVTFAEGSQLQTIGIAAFRNCTSLKEITIPASVTTIEVGDQAQDQVFDGCTNLETVTFAPGSQLQTIDPRAFNSCSNLKTIICYDASVKTLLESLNVNGVNIVLKDMKTVTLNANNGTAPTVEEVETGTVFQKPTDPTREGYVFAGWYTDEGYTKEFDFTKPITEDVTLYAKWNAATPVNPDKPSDPGTSENPGTTDKPGTSENPGTTDKPGTSDKPGTPENPGTSDKPGTPENPGTTDKPDTPEESYVLTFTDCTAEVDGEQLQSGSFVQAGKTVTLTVTAEVAGMKFDGFVLDPRQDSLTYTNEEKTTATFIMPETRVDVTVQLMPEDYDGSSWDAATVVTGVAIGAGSAVLAYHIGMEVYAEQVLGEGVAVPKTRAEVALLAWQLAGKPEVAVGEPLSEAAQAQRWAVESGLMQNEADGSFNGEKKMSKWNALRTLSAAKKMG